MYHFHKKAVINISLSLKLMVIIGFHIIKEFYYFLNKRLIYLGRLFSS